MVELVVSFDIHRDAGAYIIALLEEFCLEGIEVTRGSNLARLAALAAWAGSRRVRRKRASVGLGGHLIALHGQFERSLERT